MNFKLVINLRSKKVFFILSGLGAVFMIYQIGYITSSINIKAIDIIILFLSIVFTSATFWTPYQFNDKFL